MIKNKPTIGIIGFGIIAGRHYRNIKTLYPELEVRILTQRKDLSLDVQVFDSEKDFFQSGIEIFFITNEIYKHADTLVKCLKPKPKGIFLEKPIALDLKRASQLKRLVSKTPVFLVDHCLHFYKPIIELKRIIKNRIIGRPIFMRVSVGQDLRTWRQRDYKKSYSYDVKKGGGVATDLTHDINYPAWLIDEKIDFKAGLAKKIGLFNIKSEDMTEGIFESKSGILVSIHQDYLQQQNRRYCEIIGDRGIAIWDSAKDEVTVRSDQGESVQDVKVDRNEMYLAELSFFIDKVLKGEKYNNFEESFQDLKNALALKNTATHS